ncbi:Dicer-like protein 1 [Coemansia sp. RSA 2706]|nr:Dicer-like protein 1 [Coemansia sp. RSA 2706]KAJ2327461.1 Dicer-like protein 1 [Coemansia sp. RSA 2702]KAJ2370523.1 Dicer-like protein 1 [Coemansia sp. RSA 2610]KAJ2739533.1 Dicer-like protein 1 [Coemansia sp. Cherry 401B]
MNEQTTALTPRDYQLALFERALRSNSIVMLETGAGKTLVAVLLIEWFAQRAQGRTVRVFLSNTVALVRQQARVIAANTEQRVLEYVGAMGVDDWDAAAWARTWQRADVLVMTPQVLLNALRGGRAQLANIDLLVFDEAHHARGSHPYALLMREFYDHADPTSRPHIFGMTASPLAARQSAEAAVGQLQASLDASVCTMDLTAGAQASPTAMCCEYVLPPAYAATPLTAALAADCAGARVVERGLRTVPTVLALLGPMAADLMWHYYVQQWRRAAAIRPPPGSAPGAAEEALQDIVWLKRALEIDRTHGGELLDPAPDTLPGADTDAMHPVLPLRALGPRCRPWAELRARLSPQVNRLIGILLQWRERPSELRAIVFVARRITAVLLTLVVSLVAELDFVRADVLLGAAQKQSGTIDRPIRGGSVRTASQLTLADFADGRLNVVFATQVAEEGVDIQPCNLVIRFDMPRTATSLIQSRGRARMADSQFIVMVPRVDASAESQPEVPDSLINRDESAESQPTVPEDLLERDADGRVLDADMLPEHRGSYTDYLKLVHLEECLRDWCRAESAAAGDTGPVIVAGSRAHHEYGRLHYRLRVDNDDADADTLDEAWLEHGDRQGRIYTVTATQARITYMSAVPILHTYVQHLPQDALCRLQPIFDFEQEPKPGHGVLFRCCVTLPSNAGVRRVAGPLMPNKKLAKQAAAYRTAKKLHQLGAIDDNLAPVVVSDEPAPEEAAAEDVAFDDSAPRPRRKPKGARSSTESYEIAVPQCFVPSEAAKEAEEDGEADEAQVAPRTWHLYLLSLKHPSTDAPSRIIFASARQLPADIAVPLYINQFDPQIQPRDSSTTALQPEYLGAQTLDAAQLDTLAQFSSKLFARIMHMMLSWNPREIGSLLAPARADGSGIDFEFAHTCFADRNIVYREGKTDYSDLVGTLVMDALDHGHIKIVKEVCTSLDIYSDLRTYHAEMMGVDLANVPAAPPPAEAAGQQVQKKRKGSKSKQTVKTMANWTDIKRLNRLRPTRQVAAGVPLLRVQTISPTFNYLNLAPQHADAPEPPSEPKFGYPDGLYTSPFFCAREPLQPDAIANLSLLPAFFTRLGQLLLAHEVQSKLALPAQLHSVREAITSSSANTDLSYERLETLGDSVLKYIATVMLFVAYPDAHEGILTSRRGRIICNANLFTLSTRLKLPPHIISLVFAKRDVRLPGAGWSRMPFIPAKWICISPFFKTSMPAEGAETDAEPAGALDQDPKSEESKQRSSVEPIPLSTTRILSEKTVADVIESLLGASVRDAGIDGALAAARALGVVDSAWTSWAAFARVWRSAVATRKRKMAQLSTMRSEAIAGAGQADDSADANDLLQEMQLDQADVLFNLDAEAAAPAPGPELFFQVSQHVTGTALSDAAARQIEATLGYTFSDRAVLVEALTHCSSLDVTSSSYQRLEFLGDALLDFFLTQRYYNHEPALSPHRITLVKHIAASNDLFAIILVCHGLQRHIRHSSPIIRDVIRDYELRLSHARRLWKERQSHPDMGNDDDDGPEPVERPSKSRKLGAGAKDHCTDLYADLPPEAWNAVRAPKVLGDVLESLVGAVFVDSGMDHEAVRGVYERVLSPFLDRFVDSGKLSLHPVIQTLLVCQGWGCDMISWESGTDPNPLEFTNRYISHVTAHGQRISTATGVSPRDAKHNASEALLTMIGASAPNALDGDLSAVHDLAADQETTMANQETKLDKLLKPVCTCAERRRVEGEQRAAAEEEKRRLEEEAQLREEEALLQAVASDADAVETDSVMDCDTVVASKVPSAKDSAMDEDIEEGEVV